MVTQAPPHQDVPFRTLVTAVLAAVPIALASLALFAVIEKSIHLVWHTIPREAGWSEPAWWYVLAVPVVGGVVTALMLARMPAGEAATDGTSVRPTPIRAIGWLTAAAVATLAGGLVLGPEAPLLALGLTLGALAAKLSKQPGQEWAMAVTLAGAFTALSTVFGSPFVTLLLVLELAAAAAGPLPARKFLTMLLPGFLAAGVGALTITGMGEITGVGVHALSIPDLPAYPTVQLADVAWLIPVAAACALAVRGSLHLGGIVTARGAFLGFWLLPVGGLVVGALALLSRATTDTSVEHVLFSGQSAMPSLVVIGSTGTLLTIAACKALAFSVSVGAGFEGGLFFPALTIAAAIGVAASLVLPGASLTAMLAVSVAAGSCAVARVPMFGTVLAALLIGGSSIDVVPLIVVASVVAMLVTAPRSKQAEPPSHVLAIGNSNE